MSAVQTSAPAHANGDVVIDVHGLTKKFDGRAVVRDLSMQVRRGTIYGFLGPNGSGKTTTIRMLCGLLTPDEGTGTCLGYDIRTETDKIKRQVGYMTQRFSLYQDLSVRENLEFVARLYAVPNPTGAARDMIARLGLQGREEQLAGSLSGGWKQRLALGACTLPNPQLLLLDEPTAGVDPKARREFWNEIHSACGGRAHGAGLDPLHGRGGALPRDRLHRLWRTLDPRHGRRGDRRGEASHLHGVGDDLPRLSTELAGKPGVDSVAPFGTSLHVSGRDPDKLEAAIAPIANDPTTLGSRSSLARRRVHRPDGPAKDNFQ
jgi:ABC-2 type transport system ATP-binding protein